MPRPTKLHDPITITLGDTSIETHIDDAIVLALAQGVPFRAAAEAVNLDEGTLHRWRQRGNDYQAHLDQGGRKRPTDEPYRDFRDRVAQARAQGESRLARSIMLAASPRPVQRRETGWREVVVNRIDEAGRPYQEVVRVEINKTITTEEFDWRAAVTAGKMQYGWREPVVPLELTGQDGGPVEVRGIPQQSVSDEAAAKFREILVRSKLATAEELGMEEPSSTTAPETLDPDA